MDAWGILIDGSTLPDGDAWEHLGAQGGGGSETVIVHADGLEVEVATTEVSVEVDQSATEVSVDLAEIVVEINKSPLEVEL